MFKQGYCLNNCFNRSMFKLINIFFPDNHIDTGRDQRKT